MQWDGSPRGGFSTAQAWLPVVDPAERNVADQRDDPGSLLSFWRELIALRKGLGPGFRMLDGEPGVIAYERGDAVVTINAGDEPVAFPAGDRLIATSPGAAVLAPGDGALVKPA